MKISLPTWINQHTLLLLISLSIVTMSCSNDDMKLSTPEMQARMKSSATTAHQIFVTAQEVLDITTDVLSTEGISIEDSNASPEGCPPILINQYIKDETHYDTIIYAGGVTLDYGNGSHCSARGAVRKGMIQDIFTYIISIKEQTTFSVKQNITFQNFQRDTIQLDGSLSCYGVSGSPDTIKINSSKITYADGNSIEWKGTLINQRHNVANIPGDTRTIGGSIKSTTSDNRMFTAKIMEPIIYDYDCSGSNSLIPVKGIVEISLNDWRAIIDYGNGSCDRTYTVTMADNTVVYNF
jgi:hypothetical protein